MAKKVKTTEKRLNAFKAIAATVGLAVSASAGIVAEDRFNADIHLNEKDYTGYKYRETRRELAGIGQRLKATGKLQDEGLTADQQIEFAKDYAAFLNKEIKECGGKVYPITSTEDRRELLSRYENENCP